MALTEQQKQQILSKYGNNNSSVSDTQATDAIVENTFNSIKGQTSETKPSFLSRVNTDLKKRAGDIVNSFKKEVTSTATPLGLGRLGLRTAGAVAGTVTDIAGEAVKSVADTTGVTQALKPVGLALLDTSLGKAGLEAVKGGVESYNAFKQANPDTANALEDVLNIASLIPIGAGAKVVGNTTVDVGKKIATGIGGAGTGIRNLTKGVGNVVGSTAEGLSRIPSRISTNIAEKQATRETIAKLPTKIAQRAVQDGIDLPDVKYLYQIPKDQKAPLRKLLKVTQEFESGASKTNPIEIVGKPITNRIKELESARGTIGQKLGQIADTLGSVSTKEVYPSVFGELQKVNGLNGLKVNNKGILDFSDTVLTTAETKADRKAIQSIFNSAVKNGTGKQKHLLRQELFESLGGKKKSLTQLTDTQEKAYEAIRKGLSNVLDTKNADYKKLNKQYATVSQPLADIRKYMKNIPDATEDILDMQAGLLARRLTSLAKSNPEIRATLQSMDKATAIKGKTRLNIENLQDFYNILDKYYDIAGKTSFQGQTTAAIEKVSGVKDFISQTVGELAGRTDAVKRKAIEDALMEALK